MLRRCAWHPRYFGYVLMMGEKQPYSDPGITDGICPRCEAIVWLELEVDRIERQTKRLKEVTK